MSAAMFSEYLARWSLTPDGEATATATSHLLPVRFQDQPAMLKIAVIEEEKRGGELMAWWNGGGAAQVYAHEGDALLLARAEGTRSLTEMSRSGGDTDACRVLCEVVFRLHAPRLSSAPPTIPLTDWFRALWPAADTHGGIFALSADTARRLLAAPQDEVILHGDIHHGNVLDFEGRGWLAIDPKALRGERGFDYANIFCNPDPETAAAPGAVARRAGIVAEAAGLDRTRLLQWVLAYAGLSAAWLREDGEAPAHALQIAEQAAAELRR